MRTKKNSKNWGSKEFDLTFTVSLSEDVEGCESFFKTNEGSSDEMTFKVVAVDHVEVDHEGDVVDAELEVNEAYVVVDGVVSEQDVWELLSEPVQKHIQGIMTGHVEDDVNLDEYTFPIPEDPNDYCEPLDIWERENDRYEQMAREIDEAGYDD